MLAFETPSYLLLLLLLFPLIYIRHFMSFSGRSLTVSIAVWGKDGIGVRQPGVFLLLGIGTLAYWLGTFALIFALSGPTINIHERVYLNRGMDIFVVLDQSPSMAAKDIPPTNRMDAAKAMIQELVASRQNDAIGLVGFGEEALLKVPPTTDYETFSQRLEESYIMELGEGTAIGMGLAIAVVHLSESSSEQKVIILITDGDNNSGEIQPEVAADMAAQLGIRVYTIGMGVDGDVPFELENPKTGQTEVGDLRSSFNEALLKDLADIGGGLFFKASSMGALKAILRTINSLEVVEGRVRVQVRTIPLHRWFILIGGGLIFVELLVRKILLREVP